MIARGRHRDQVADAVIEANLSVSVSRPYCERHDLRPGLV
jgi:hypothetical protein